MIAKLIAPVIPLGLDTFAVAAALGMLGTTSATRLRVSLLLTAFEAAMPLVGLGLGAPLGHAIGHTADYIAIGVLLAFGHYTLLGSEEHEQRTVSRGPRAGALLLGLSISLDELAIGFTLGLLRPPLASSSCSSRSRRSSSPSSGFISATVSADSSAKPPNASPASLSPRWALVLLAEKLLV